MKFTITSITKEGLRGKMDNPFPKPTRPTAATSEEEATYYTLLSNWEFVAEANRKEYKIAKTEIIDMTIIEGDFDYRIGNQGISYPTELGDRIDGDIKDNQIINIKIL